MSAIHALCSVNQYAHAKRLFVVSSPYMPSSPVLGVVPISCTGSGVAIQIRIVTAEILLRPVQWLILSSFAGGPLRIAVIVEFSRPIY